MRLPINVARVAKDGVSGSNESTGVSLIGNDRRGETILPEPPHDEDKETPSQKCPFCDRVLIRAKYPKWPNQYDRSRWKKVLVCTRHGPVKEVFT